FEALQPTDAAKSSVDANILPKEPTGLGRDWIWRAQVFDMLQSRVSKEAAENYKLDVQKTDNPSTSSLGMVGFALRNPAFILRPITSFASWNSWTWRTDSHGRNTPYLTGLAIIALFLAILRAGMLNLMNYAAATATLDAATRLRRAIYHQSYRLGTLALKAHPAEETVEIFARDVEQ